MSLLTLRVFPDEVLRRKATHVSSFDKELRRLLEDMAETMYAHNGVGLAANQVGVLYRAVTIDVAQDDKDSNLLYMVNPVIKSRNGTMKATEGCLSFPKLEIEVKRSQSIVVSYFDEEGVARELTADGLLAICIQHEIDHLDGVLFIDRVGLVSRRLALREYERLLKGLDEG